ncbi:MAG: phosphopantothenoylcysteine decarboxylase/phosphopantothenate--cysteine ligase [Sulfurimonas sp.]|jgi:phosphopantothenoylcysteine decarboxylase/phosphopantothenate--cysteine ligase|uniref:bifunctional phosphopantothenoylcysteine decarboxylase/phosphopantothenate--cysteine ligase CoaBC n=1 Tax=Sulfurimonas sp. TaxID=2022749 RepID=UPI0039E621A2
MIIPDNLLKNKKILLGVTGSIAVYKSLELTRLFIKAGAQVRVIMSDSAKKFVTPLSFETLTSNKVLDDTNESWVNDHNHIKISEWADLFVIAPATANTIAKLANAIADNILLQCALAYPAKKLLAPSANTNMLESPLTQQNIKMLQNANYELVDTQIKELACKTTGDGAMADPLDIFWHATKVLLQNEFYKNRTVIVTGGGTIEKIDDVRYISNFSSGKMASAMASALYSMGADVHLISTKFEDNIPKSIHTIEVQSSAEMIRELIDSIKITKTEKIPYLFMAAAVSDYVPKDVLKGKLKKDTLGNTFELALTKNIDILDSINKKGLVTIGFKAEMDASKAQKSALNMLRTKKLDAVCLNILKNSSSFGSDMNAIEFITTNKQESLKDTDKLSLAFEILKYAQEI